MNRRTTWVVVVLMSIALVGLTSFQIYWINNALELNKKRFKENVFESLNYVVRNLEDREVVHFADNEFFIADPKSANVHIIGPPGSEPIKIISQSSTALSYTDEHNGMLTIESHALEGDSSIRILRKKEAVNIVIDKLISDKKTIRQRVNQNVIDSLLTKSLHQQGIDIKFEYAVWNAADDTVVLSNAKNDLEEVKNSELKASLFPNDIMDNMNYLVLNFPNEESFLFREVWLTLLTSIIFILTIIGCFGYAIYIIFRQKRLSEIKNDFINNMTHELKTPLATVSLACQALNEPEITSNSGQLSRYIGIISDENKRLTHQVEKVLQSALLDKKNFELEIENTDIIQLLHQSTEKHNLTIESRDGVLQKEFKEDSLMVRIDREHMINVFHNLIDNAIKYSLEKPTIKIHESVNNNTLTIKISDKGIGIRSGDTAHVFDKFYRVSTGDRHDVKGFGLGLSYVKNIVEKHKGQITVNSELGKGSTFTIKLPLV